MVTWRSVVCSSCAVRAAPGKGDRERIEVDVEVVQLSCDVEPRLRDVELSVEERLAGRREGVGDRADAAVGRPEEALDPHGVVRRRGDRAARPLDDHGHPVGVDRGIVVRDVRRVRHVEVPDRHRGPMRHEPRGRIASGERGGHDLLTRTGLEPVDAGAVDDPAVARELRIGDAVRDLRVGETADVLHHAVRDAGGLDPVPAVADVAEADRRGVGERRQRREDDHQGDDRLEDR